MKIISFYSYKGGVGRSLALTYIAKKLADNNVRVCVLDIDLEASGIVYKFLNNPKEKVSKEDVISKLGLIDYIQSYKNNINADVNIEDYFSTVYEEKKYNYGYIKLMNAGKSINTHEYWDKLSKIDWNELFLHEDAQGVRLFIKLLSHIKTQFKPDYLFIDSRAGITMMSKLCNSVLPDKVIMFLANNDENYYGSGLIYNHIADSKNYNINKKTPDIFCAITRYPKYDTKDKKTTLDLYQEKEKKKIKENFINIVFNEKLKEDDISFIHSDRGIERNESLIFNDDYTEKRDGIGGEYKTLIDNFIEEEILERIKSFVQNVPKHRFIESYFNDYVENELKSFSGNLSLLEYHKKIHNDIAENPNSCQNLYKLALCERYDGKLIDSIMILNAIINNCEENDKYWILAHYWRGVIFLYDFNNYEYSRNDLEVVYNVNKSFNLRITYDLALCYFMCDEYELAKEYINNYLSMKNIISSAFILRARINYKLKLEKQDIILDFDEARRTNPNDKYLYFYSGIVYHDYEEKEEAIKSYNKTIQLDSEFAPAYNNRGLLFSHLFDEKKKALDDYNKAIDIYKKYDSILQNIDDPKEAHVIKNELKYAYYSYNNRGNLYLELGYIKEALEDYDMALKYIPDSDTIKDKIKENQKKAGLFTDIYYNNLQIHFDNPYYFYMFRKTEHINVFPFPIKYNKIDENYEFSLIRDEAGIFITDQEKTLKMLNKIYELNEQDVRKNLVLILNEFHVLKNGDSFTVKIFNDNTDYNNYAIEEAKYRLLRCISFMNKMIIFYEFSKCNDCDKIDGCEKHKNRNDEYKFTLYNGETDITNFENKYKNILFPVKYHRIDMGFEFVIKEKNEKYYLSDQGRTYKMLDEVFELKEPDVQKNISAIMEECQVFQNDDEFLIEIESLDKNMILEKSTELEKAKYKLFECISFMDTMRIFYV